MSCVSTWMGDRLGIHGAVDLLPPAFTFQVHPTRNKGIQPYHLEYTSSRPITEYTSSCPITEVKQG